jgi:hypothetical protein
MSTLEIFLGEKFRLAENFLFLLWDQCDGGSDGKSEGRPARFGGDG